MSLSKTIATRGSFSRPTLLPRELPLADIVKMNVESAGPEIDSANFSAAALLLSTRGFAACNLETASQLR